MLSIVLSSMTPCVERAPELALEVKECTAILNRPMSSLLAPNLVPRPLGREGPGDEAILAPCPASCCLLPQVS